MNKRATTADVFEIEVSALRAVLGDVIGVVEARNTIPVLSNVLLEVTPTALVVTGTDLDAWVSRHVAIEAGRSFSLTVHGATLKQVAAKLPADARCMLSVADGKLTIVAGRARFTLPTLPVEDFPTVVTSTWDAEFEIAAITLAVSLDRVMHAMSSEEARYYLNGVYLHTADAELRFAATDGHRLARICQPAPDGAAAIGGVIVPRKAVRLIEPLLGRHDGMIDVRATRSRIRFEIGATTVDAKLIDGTFPDYQRVIPDHPDVLSIDREALVAAIGRVVTMSSDKARPIKMDVASDKVVLTVTSPEKGLGTDEVPCQWSGAPASVGFNARFLLEALGQLTAVNVEGRLGDAKAPTMWRDGEGSPAVFVVMPMRV
jgi:DNA polymerase III subunit beta